MCGIPLALGGSAHLSVCGKEGALCVECLVILVPSSPYPLLSTVYHFFFKKDLKTFLFNKDVNF